MSVCWTPMCEVLVPKMFVCAMPYVLVPVVLQWDIIVLDDCVPDVFVMDSFRGCLFCMSVCIMYVCRIYIQDVCVIDDCVVIVGVRYLCVFNAQIWNVCLRSVSVCDQCLFGEWLCGFNILFWWHRLCSIPLCGISVCWMAEFRLCLQDFCAVWMFIQIVFVMGACRGCLFCMSVCIMYVCRIYILDVCVFDDCVAVVGV